MRTSSRRPERSNQCDWRPLRLDDSRARLTVSFWNTFRRLQLCYQTVTQQEAVQGWRYEYLLRVRPDVELPTAMLYNSQSADPLAISVFSSPVPFTSLADHFAIVPRRGAHVYFNTANVYYQCIPSTLPKAERDSWCTHPNVDSDPDFAPECYLAKWLKEHHIKVRAFNYPVETIVRGNKQRSDHPFMN